MGKTAHWGLRHIRYFKIVCEEQSFRAAASRLHVAQSAISRRIQELEEALHVQLLERGPKGVTITAAGQILLAHACNIDHVLERTRLDLDEYRDAPLVIRVAFPRETAQLSFMPNLIAQFHKAYPDIRLELVPMTRIMVDEARPDLADVFFYPHPQTLKGLKSKLLLSGEYCLVIPGWHRLSAKKSISFSDIVDENFILFTRASNREAYDQLLKHSASIGVQLRIVHETASEETRLALVSAGMGLTFAPRQLVNKDANLDIAYSELKDLKLTTSVQLGWRESLAQHIIQPFLDVTDLAVTDPNHINGS